MFFRFVSILVTQHLITVERAPFSSTCMLLKRHSWRLQYDALRNIIHGLRLPYLCSIVAVIIPGWWKSKQWKARTAVTSEYGNPITVPQMNYVLGFSIGLNILLLLFLSHILCVHVKGEIRLVTIFVTISITSYSTNDWNHDWNRDNFNPKSV